MCMSGVTTTPPVVTNNASASGMVAGVNGGGAATPVASADSPTASPVNDATSGVALLDAFQSLIVQMQELVTRLSDVLAGGSSFTSTVAVGNPPVIPTSTSADSIPVPTPTADPAPASDSAPVPESTSVTPPSEPKQSQSGTNTPHADPVNHDPNKDASYLKLKQHVEVDRKSLARQDVEIVKQQTRIDVRRRDLQARNDHIAQLRTQLDNLKSSAWYRGKFGQEDRAVAIEKAHALESQITTVSNDAHRIELEINGLVHGMRSRVEYREELRIKLRNDRFEMEQRAKIVSKG